MYNQQQDFRSLPSKVKANIIRVSGSGKVFVQPNQAEITLGVSTEGTQLENVQKENAVAIEKIKSGLNSIGVSDEQIRTINYSIYPQYDFIDGKQTFRGYKAEHTLLITIRDLERAGLVVDSAVKNGANIITGIHFSVEQPSQYEQQALSYAVIDSFQKAEAIAKTLGVRLNHTPTAINEINPQRGEPILLHTTAFVKSEASTPIQPGMMEIRSQILAEYVYFK